MLENQKKIKCCDPFLQHLLYEVAKITNLRIIEGLRTVDRQQRLIDEGKSKISNARHAPHVQGIAVDIIPLDKNREFHGWGEGKDEVKEVGMFYNLHGIIYTVAKHLIIPIRWGGDWDGDGSFKDQTFDDLVHYEVIK